MALITLMVRGLPTIARMPAVVFDQVAKTYAAARGDVRALDGISFAIEAGEFFGLLGPNGAGKTTLISILAGLARATRGSVTVMGHDVVRDYAAARKSLGIVPQELVFDPFFSVRECLRIQSGYFGIRRNDAWIDELLAGLGLADKADVNTRQLSGGMKRRVLVAQALVHKPPVIVLDEPTAGVDVELRQTLWGLIANLNKQGHTVLLTTHYLEEAEALCGRIAMLKQGRVVSRHARRHGEHDAALQDRRRVAGERGGTCARDGPHCAGDGTRRGRGRNPARPVAPGRREDRRPGDRPRRSRRRVPRDHAERNRMNFEGARTLFNKEILRFWKVSVQTVAAPVLTAVLYLLIFGHVLEAHVQVFPGVGYTSFLIPGLVMMSVLQNAYANSSSSLIQSKISGNLVFLLVSPLSHWAWFAAYVGASVVRGLAVGVGVFAVTVWFAPAHFEEPWWIVVFAVLGAGMLGALGLLSGLWAEKFDQTAAFQNFLIMPMTFLSGVFYSVHSLPAFWQGLSHLNPFFYMIDGFRRGFFGVSDVSPWLSLAVVGLSFLIVSAIALRLLATGYKIRS
jgi:ABC-2 type transport system permease protein